MTVIVLGIILLVIGYFTGLSILYTIGGILLVILAIARWKRKEKQSRLPLENFFESFVGAIRYVRYAPGIQVVLARNVLFSLFISVIPALLPVIGLKEVLMNSADLGLLFTSMGVGSVAGAIIVIPWARARFSPNSLTIFASVLLAMVFVLMAVVRAIPRCTAATRRGRNSAAGMIE